MLAFSPSNKQETKSCPQLLCQLPVQFLFVQGSLEPEVLTLRLLVLLRAPRPALPGLPGMWGRRCSPAGPPLISTHWPSGLFSPLCTQLGLGSGNFLQDSAFFFFFFYLFCKPGCIKTVGNIGWYVILYCLSTYRNRCTETQRYRLAGAQRICTC